MTDDQAHSSVIGYIPVIRTGHGFELFGRANRAATGSAQLIPGLIACTRSNPGLELSLGCIEIITANVILYPNFLGYIFCLFAAVNHGVCPNDRGAPVPGKQFVIGVVVSRPEFHRKLFI